MQYLPFIIIVALNDKNCIFYFSRIGKNITFYLAENGKNFKLLYVN